MGVMSKARKNTNPADRKERLPMFKKMMLAIAVVVVPANLALAAPNTEPAVEQTNETQEIQPAELSLPGIVIDEAIADNKIDQKVEADCQAYLTTRLAAQEQELMKVFESASQDTRVSASTTSPASSGS
jgi:hypothetical protein